MFLRVALTGAVRGTSWQKSLVRWNSQSKVTEAVKALANAQTASDIHSHYGTLRHLFRYPKGGDKALLPPSPFSEEQFSHMLELLAASAKSGDLSRAKQVIGDMHDLFAIEPTAHTYSAVIRALCYSRNIKIVFDWLDHLDKPPSVRSPPRQQLYHTALYELIRLNTSFQDLRTFLTRMRMTGTKPTVETFCALIRARWKYAMENNENPDLMVFESLVDEIRTLNLPLSDEISDTLAGGYEQVGDTDRANKIKAYYLSSGSNGKKGSTERDIWATEVEECARDHGVDKAVERFRELRSNGAISSRLYMDPIIRHARTVEELRLIEKEFETTLTLKDWDVTLRKSLQADDIRNAVFIYDASRESGIIPTSFYVSRFIRRLCMPGDNSPSQEEVAFALALYRDLSRSHPPLSKASENVQQDHGPDLHVFQCIMHGLSTCPNPEEYREAFELIDKDMDQRKLPKDRQFTASMVIFHMRLAKDLDAALDVYYRHRNSLNVHGYNAVLAAFSHLRWTDKMQMAPVDSYFSIVRDMRRAGHPVTIRVYTILLNTLSQYINEVDLGDDTTIYAQALETARKAHDFLSLDASVNADAPFYNSLLNIYQRLDSYGECYRLWDHMFLTGNFDEASVSIIFDACGRGGYPDIANKVRISLLRERYPFNVRHWNAWVECLCRTGNVGTAFKWICLEMGKAEVVPPDDDVVRTLLSYTPPTSRRNVLNEIKIHHPNIPLPGAEAELVDLELHM